MENIKEEIKKEFQLERMILFSDAVFAIVITLMAIEIKLPESIGKSSQEEFLHHLKELLPTFLAYVVSFFFIGMFWYRHLKLFGFLKTYDLGLVVRNLVLLFFIGLFPFAASLIARPTHTFVPVLVYLIIVVACIISQLNLQHYILITKPQLRNDHKVEKMLFELKLGKIAAAMFTVSIILYLITYQLIEDEALKSMAILWLCPMALIIRVLRNRLKKKELPAVKTAMLSE